MRTSELAGQVGVNTETLRYYERRGLLAEPPRTPGGYRDYPTGAVNLLRFIKRAQELGFTLDEVEELVHLNHGGPDSCDAARALAVARKADLEARIADLQRMRESLNDLIATCDLPRADRSCALLEAIENQPPNRPARSHRPMNLNLELEVLHVPDCTNLPSMLGRLREVTDLAVTTREITTDAEAAALGMAGSPTLLINGTDPFTTPDQCDCGVSCRLYRDEHDRLVPAPSVAQLRDALAAAGGTTPATVSADGPAASESVQPGGSVQPGEVLSAWRTRTLPLNPAEQAVHQAILRTFATTGHPPTSSDLNPVTAGTGRTTGEVLAALHDLDAIRLAPHGQVAVAFPAYE